MCIHSITGSCVSDSEQLCASCNCKKTSNRSDIQSRIALLVTTVLFLVVTYFHY